MIRSDENCLMCRRQSQFFLLTNITFEFRQKIASPAKQRRKIDLPKRRITVHTLFVFHLLFVVSSVFLRYSRIVYSGLYRKLCDKSSLVIPATKYINIELDRMKATLKTPASRIFTRKILSALSEKLNTYKERTIGRISMLLDARFRKKCFQFEKNYESAFEISRCLVRADLERQRQAKEDLIQ